MHTFHSAPLHLKLLDANHTRTGEFSGYASTFGGDPDSQGHVIEPGAFNKSLARHSAEGTKPAMLWQHNRNQPVGVWLSMVEDSRGLLVSGKLTLDVALAKESYALMKDGALAMSIGFFMLDAKPLGAGLSLVKEIDLLEVSLVSLPANKHAVITEVKSFNPNNPREFERQVRDALGLSSREAKRLMSGGWSALVRDEQSDNSQELALIASRLEEITKSLRTN
ncbi:HK97 family phage prohead protease [Pseudomonas asplenii]|uniref:Prohead serine protease domain-containing protein n=1 Tax=Pseudomonas asplenii TaxID=53407 RepID=A0A1H6N0I9_9PSED|nr:HK97 family phage prohead protease [Pseudomonas fuscovaginae]SEI03583.1 prohead peptidase. Unknown type peptidase. MEROPS family U35 [Pseudomonas fuscovaginae]